MMMFLGKRGEPLSELVSKESRSVKAITRVVFLESDDF